MAQAVAMSLKTGFESNEIFGVNIYPNPVKNSVSIKFDNVNNVKQIQILNLIGKVLIEKTGVQATETIDMSNFSKGIYIIGIKTDKGIFVRKIVKE